MKKYLLPVVAIGLLASCSKDQPTTTAPADRIPIVPNAGINVTSRAITGPIIGDEFPANNADVFHLSAFAGTAAPSTNWLINADGFENLAVRTDGIPGGETTPLFSLTTPKYYPAVKTQLLYFYAFGPAPATYDNGTASTAPVAKWTINGQQDIIYANETSGIGGADDPTDQDHPTFTFRHLLKKVTFTVKAGDNFDQSGIYVTSISVIGVKTKPQLTLGATALDWTADATTGNLSLTGLNAEILPEGTPVTGALMFQSGSTFLVRVVASSATYADVTVNLTDGGAGVSSNVTLTFYRTGIVPSATITNWTTGAAAEVNVQ